MHPRRTQPRAAAAETAAMLQRQRDADLVRTSGLFDASWYLLENPDVARAGMDPALHWVIHGWREGRSPGGGFSAGAYLEANPDVAAAGMNPLVHYVLHGKSEGRRLALPYLPPMRRGAAAL